MFNRSSIFSFNIIKEFPIPTPPFILSILILFCIGSIIATSRGCLEKACPRYLSISPVLSYLNNYYQDEPKVIFLGSSRFVSGIKTYAFAKLADIEPQKVLNLSVDSGSFWESRLICSKNPKLFKNRPLTIIEVEPWMLNNNVTNPITKDKCTFEPYFTVWATLKERFDPPGIITKLHLVLDFFFPLTERRSFSEWCSEVQSLIIPGKTHIGLSIPAYQYNDTQHQSLASNQNFSAVNIVHNDMNKYEFSEYKAEYLRSLVMQLADKSDHVILMQSPVRQKYIEIIHNNPEYLFAYKRFLKFIHSLETTKVSSIIWETPKDCGLDESVFIDYGHFNLSGSLQFTEMVYKKLNDGGLISSICLEKADGRFPADETIARLQENLKYQPENLSSHYTLGIRYEKDGQFGKAEKEFKNALTIEPNSFQVLEALTALYLDQKRYNEGISTLKSMSYIQPNNENIYYNIACLYALIDQKNESIHWLKKAIDKGYHNLDHLKTDKDLEKIRRIPEFNVLLNMIK